MSEFLPILGIWLALAVLACGLGLAVAALEVDLATWELRRTTPTLEIRAGMWRGLVILIAVGALVSVVMSAPSGFNLTIIRVAVLALCIGGSAVGYVVAKSLWPRAWRNVRAQWRGAAIALALGLVLLVAAYLVWTTPNSSYVGLLSLQGTGDRGLNVLVSTIPRLPPMGASVLGVVTLLVTGDVALRLTSSKSATRRSPGTVVITLGSVAVGFLAMAVAVRLDPSTSFPLTPASAATLLTVVTIAYVLDFFTAHARHPIHAGIALLASASAAACVPWALPVLVVAALVFAVTVLRLRRKRERRAVMADIVTSFGPVLALVLVVVAGWLVSVFVVA